MIDSLPKLLLLAFWGFTAPMPLSAEVPVRVIGNTGADETLMKDILQTMSYRSLFA